MAEPQGDAVEEALRKEFEEIVGTLVGHARDTATDTIRQLTSDLKPAAANLQEAARTASVAMQAAEAATSRHQELQGDLQNVRNTLQTLIQVVRETRSQLDATRTTLTDLQAQQKQQSEEHARRLRELHEAAIKLALWVGGVSVAVLGVLFFVARRM